MDSPILPTSDRTEDSPQTTRILRRSAQFRLVAAAIAIVASAVGLRSQIEARHLAVVIESGSVAVGRAPASPPVFGDPTPAALLPAARSGGMPRTVCWDETRPLPTSGAWTCKGWIPLDTDEFGRRATDTGGPCTHRVASQAGGAWNCWTRIAIPAVALHMSYAVPLMFGHLVASAPGGSATHPQICREEARSAETSGRWTCVGAQDPPAGWRIVEPVDPGGSCSYRVADERTGVWSCQSETSQDPGVP
jgi:hypothetical protein